MKQELVKSEPKNEIVVYQPNETMRLEVAIQDDTVWLNQMQMAELFGRERSVIAKHIRNATGTDPAKGLKNEGFLKSCALARRFCCACAPIQV